ncbi:MAG: Ni/Fe hydrogenase subunit alpha [Candidatus Euphemobacter frigidus]|nr:Ni/Fe hydrogenase subunit alpha [Candidatus Euphemobacter frigidus]MDP8276302.1 Ni/Fe hydrogenase subunit alpha [Candidatus Euphemobacter frigidus]
MKVEMKIDVHHLTRVEGHGNINIRVKDGKLVEAQWAVVETPRFFEAMLKGISYNMAPTLSSRICGICSISHTLASLRAVERAMKVNIPRAAKLLRLLAKHGETLQSHILHIFFLAAPDLFGVSSVIPLIKSHPEVAGLALRLKELANRICDLITGRTTHPVSLVVGGVSKVPEKKELETLKEEIIERLPDIQATVELFRTLSIPDFVRETEFVSLKGKRDYPWIGGELVSSDGVIKKEDDYLAMTNEYKEDFTTSKFTRLSRESFAVGALARFNNNYRFLPDRVKAAARKLNLQPVNYNPFMNNIAQVIECYHVMLEAIDILDKLLDNRLDRIRAGFRVKAGEGVGAVGAPRGILYHSYILNRKGVITKANCIIPTTQNNANIHHDMAALVQQSLKQNKNDMEITRLSEMLVRAYDPCISCSVH